MSKNTSIGQDIIDLMSFFEENKKEIFEPILSKIDDSIQNKKVLRLKKIYRDNLSFLLGDEKFYFYYSRLDTKSSIIYQALKDEIVDRINK